MEVTCVVGCTKPPTTSSRQSTVGNGYRASKLADLGASEPPEHLNQLGGSELGMGYDALALLAAATGEGHWKGR